jgi:hypothetical protein
LRPIVGGQLREGARWSAELNPAQRRSESRQADAAIQSMPADAVREESMTLTQGSGETRRAVQIPRYIAGRSSTDSRERGTAARELCTEWKMVYVAHLP